MKKIYRSKRNKVLGGFLAGLGYRFKIDPSIIRLVFIFLGTLTAFLPLTIIYIIACFITPIEPKGYKPPRFPMLYRSVTNRKIAGICGGISEYFKIDATIVRIVFVLLVFFTGVFPLLIAYLLGIIIIPEKRTKDQVIEIFVD